MAWIEGVWMSQERPAPKTKRRSYAPNSPSEVPTEETRRVQKDTDPSAHEEERWNEAALIARTLQGDRTAFDVLFRRYQDYVYRIVYGIVGNAEEAKDLTQDVFLQAFRSLGRFRGQAKFATWLYRIAVNRATDAVRTAQRKRFLPLWDWMVSSASETADCREFPEVETTRGQVQEALLRCPLVLRQALVLRYYNECSLEEMAEILNCSTDAVKVRLHRARAMFRQVYEVVCREEEPLASETRSEE
ncbi:RNA polymerase sigma factor [Chthonomonas calidirosea]|uniref:RNA polymerase sigma factor n=1 Tax=Chthonomonas calidirosea TaxID=454171 RepID=UPI0006EC4F97|nr:sigma-70 family RNA polymerase sigma factor [Chthonomonas calidirosea]CEK16026.1 RNA polymerase, sigma subunit, ECF family [Chthonomonas calidirosea]